LIINFDDQSIIDTKLDSLILRLAHQSELININNRIIISQNQE